MQVRTQSHQQRFRHFEESTTAQQRSPGKVKLGADYYDEVADAKDRDSFYAAVKDDFGSASGEDLFLELNKLVTKNHRPLGYSEARKNLYGEVDRRPDGGLYYLYSGDGIKNESEYTAPHRGELGNYNCEHVVPQSWFQKSGTPKGDLHHLFTEQIQCNGSRGNFPLKETSGETIPACGILNPGEAFEPKAGKGEVARATLYFITRYPGEVGDAANETQRTDLKQLLEWHREYPVTDYERHRNETIQDAQGNRNPYIDYPELAEKVDFKTAFGDPRRFAMEP